MSAALLDIDYSKLYSRAGQRGETSELTQNMYFLDQLLACNYDVRYLLNFVDFSTQKRIDTLLEIPGFVSSKTFEELLFLILENRQIVSFHTIYHKYISDLVTNHSFCIVEAVLPVDLQPSFLEEVSASLQKSLGKKIVLKTRVDETLVGGIVLKLPDGKIFDYSYKTKMNNFKSYVMEKGLS
jgi:F-type H+-transporting ATPase subunit delta